MYDFSHTYSSQYVLNPSPQFYLSQTNLPIALASNCYSSGIKGSWCNYLVICLRTYGPILADVEAKVIDNLPSCAARLRSRVTTIKTFQKEAVEKIERGRYYLKLPFTVPEAKWGGSGGVPWMKGPVMRHAWGRVDVEDKFSCLCCPLLLDVPCVLFRLWTTCRKDQLVARRQTLGAASSWPSDWTGRDKERTEEEKKKMQRDAIKKGIFQCFQLWGPGIGVLLIVSSSYIMVVI